MHTGGAYSAEALDLVIYGIDMMHSFCKALQQSFRGHIVFSVAIIPLQTIIRNLFYKPLQIFGYILVS